MRNMFYCLYPPKHNKTDFLILTPATFSVKVKGSGQWTERALFSDSIIFYAALIKIIMITKRLYLEYTFKISHIFKNSL